MKCQAFKTLFYLTFTTQSSSYHRCARFSSCTGSLGECWGIRCDSESCLGVVNSCTRRSVHRVNTPLTAPTHSLLSATRSASAGTTSSRRWKTRTVSTSSPTCGPCPFFSWRSPASPSGSRASTSSARPRTAGGTSILPQPGLTWTLPWPMSPRASAPRCA
jgi:hypothetical protein